MKFSRSNQGGCLILCLFIRTSSEEAVRVREMDKNCHEHAKVRAVTQLTLRCSSQSISSRVDFISFRIIFFLSDGRYGFRRFPRVERWSTSVLFQDEKRKQLYPTEPLDEIPALQGKIALAGKLNIGSLTCWKVFTNTTLAGNLCCNAGSS